MTHIHGQFPQAESSPASFSLAFLACTYLTQFIAQDVCDSKSLAALSGMALRSLEPRLSLLALDRLIPLVDTCSAAEFIQFIARPGGVLAAAHQMALISATSQDSSLQPKTSFSAAAFCKNMFKSAHPWQVAVTSAGSAVVPRTVSAPSASACPTAPILMPDFSAPQSGAIRDVACTLLLAGLDRARRMGGCKAMQVSYKYAVVG